MRGSFFVAITCLVLGVIAGARADWGGGGGPGGVTVTQVNAMVQGVNASTDASGNWTVNWSSNFASATPVINAIPLNPSLTSPITCNVGARTVNTASGKCWLTQSASNGILGINISLGASNPPTSTAIMVIGRDTTQ